MATIASLIIRIGATTGDLVAGTNKAKAALGGLENQAKATKVAFGGLGGLGSLAGGFGITTIMKDSIAAFMEAERELKLVESQVRATGGAAGRSASQIADMASALQTVTTFADEATLSAAKVLLSFTKITDTTFDQTLMIAQDLSTVMGQDLQTSVVQIGKALQDPLKGITSLKRIGVDISAEQKKQIANLLEQNKTYLAQQVILRELRKEFGGAAIAEGNTSSGKVKRLKNVLGEVGEDFGGGLVDLISGQVFKDIAANPLAAIGLGGSTKIARAIVPADNAVRAAMRRIDGGKQARRDRVEDSIGDQVMAKRLKQAEKFAGLMMTGATLGSGTKFEKASQERAARDKAVLDAMPIPEIRAAQARMPADKPLMSNEEFQRRKADVLAFADGKISQDEFHKREAQTKKLFPAGGGMTDTRGAGALQFGTAAAFSAANRSNPQTQVAENTKQILEEARKENRLLNDNTKALKSIDDKLKVVEIA